MSMKSTFRCLSVILVICLLTLSACSVKEVNNVVVSGTVQYTLRERFDMNLNASGDTGEVVHFTAERFNGDEQTQAFAVVNVGSACDLWYTDSETSVKLVESVAISIAPTVVITSAKAMYIVDVTSSDGATRSYAYIVIDGCPVRLDGAGEDLTSMGGDDFFTNVSAVDRKLSDGTLNGESKKKYYLYFDGTALKEYGGIKITKTEFLQLNKSDAILSGIEECGYTVTDIIYRANGLININCEKTVSGETVYDNLTVKVLGKNAICLPSGLNQGGDYVGRSTYGGIYELSAFHDIATYPKEFEVK